MKYLKKFEHFDPSTEIEEVLPDNDPMCDTDELAAKKKAAIKKEQEEKEAIKSIASGVLPSNITLRPNE